ncbi:hypothetical protein ACHHYP_08013 [Achlya hypogyna]|uniref:Uncharacterized protein n=1 Tax=Achlya hypogyna TaxID=1202772 RepID=A0A1V9YQ80_ACHHY|nr:hypothetical protein ACHHYP_08013 [Achlya hypogyna]
MLAPDRLAGRSTLDASDVVRIALEPRGIVGFIQVPALTTAPMTLADARPLVLAAIDDLPDDVQFLYGDTGLPISRVQEAFHLVSDHYPCIKLRPTPPAKNAKANAYQVSVTNAHTHQVFMSWIPSTYTFGQLRRDAARYWDVQPSAASLEDQSGCAWPEEAAIASTLLEADGMQSQRLVLVNKQEKRTPPPATFAPPAAQNLDGKLWYVFTFYCVHGDALDLLAMTAYQFHRFLRDCRLFNASFTPAMGDIIYAFEGKGKLSKVSVASRRTSGKLDFDGFLNALATIAARRARGETEAAALQSLLSNYVLPRALSWSISTWQQHTALLAQDDVRSFVANFESMLADIFVFYTNQPLSATETASSMAFPDYMRFINDFHFTELLLSTQECPEIFLAACQAASRRDSMDFTAFLDMLGRAGVVALTRHRNLKPLQCVKAVFHHMTRGLKSSRALEIIHNHGPTALYAARFYAGCVAFSHKFLDVWRVEGSPDYITGCLPLVLDDTTRGRDMLAQMVRAAPVVPLPLPVPSTKPAPRAKEVAGKAAVVVAPKTRRSTVPPPPPADRPEKGWGRSASCSDLNAADDNHVTLVQGSVFRKYGAWGTPQRRYVWCSDDGEHLYWRSLKSKKPEDGIAVRSIQAVLPGNTETTKYAFMKHLSEGM